MLANLAAGTVLVTATVIVHGIGLLVLSGAAGRRFMRYRPHRNRRHS